MAKVNVLNVTSFEVKDGWVYEGLGIGYVHITDAMKDECLRKSEEGYYWPFKLSDGYYSHKKKLWVVQMYEVV